MDWRHLLVGSLTLAVLGGSADAGILFNRSKSKDPPPNQSQNPPAVAQDRVGELVKVLRGSPDERKRAVAADELAKADLRQHPQAGEALIAALQQDPSANVRAEVAQAIGKMRPLTLQGGQALEEAMNSDSAPRVRQVAKTAIGVYLQAGYRTGVPESKGLAQAPAAPRPPAARPTPPVPQRPAGRQTNEPPLAASKPRQDKSAAIELKPEPGPAPSAPRLLGPVKESKADPVKPTKPAKADDEGPILTGPG
jgi:HEAT repeats